MAPRDLYTADMESRSLLRTPSDISQASSVSPDRIVRTRQSFEVEKGVSAIHIPTAPEKDSDVNLKFWLLLLLVVQGSSAILTGRYTRSSVPEEELYEISHLVLTIECVKFCASVVAEFVSTKGKFMASVKQHILINPLDSCKVLVPSVLYVVQSSLIYIALSNLTAPVFISLQQGKLIATAIVSVAMLNRSYSTKQWLCLFVLAIGVTIVALDERGEQSASSLDEEEGDDAILKGAEDITEIYAETETTEPENTQVFLVGFLAVTGACFSSAFAGVYFEKVLAPEKANKPKKVVKVGDVETADKDDQAAAAPTPPSLWIRNMQLAFFSIVFAYLQGVYDLKAAIQLHNQGEDDEEEEAESIDLDQRPFFHGFTKYVWLLVVLQAGGGLLVAAVMKYADNVLKGLAMGIGVVVASVMSTLLFDVELSGQFALGAAIILGSVYCFSNDIPCLPKERCK